MRALTEHNAAHAWCHWPCSKSEVGEDIGEDEGGGWDIDDDALKLESELGGGATGGEAARSAAEAGQYYVPPTEVPSASAVCAWHVVP